ncbi:MAG: hypothetical protein N5P05_002689 [Chroococcopsis gigantea SAG 12.99]|nr:hypothetical protein [Chroococcopsis gigantea SAG 12.99]
MVGELHVNRQEFDKLNQEIELVRTMLGALKLHNEYLEKTNHDLKVAFDDAKNQANSLNQKFTAGLDEVKNQADNLNQKLTAGLNDVKSQTKNQADSLNQGFTAKLDDVKNQVKNQADNLNQKLTAGLNDVKSQTKNQADSLNQGFTAKLDDVKNQVDSLNKANNMLVGSIVPFTTAFPPDGWLECNGQTVSRERFSELFKKINVVFGAGDGLTNFQLPNLKGQFVRGWDQTGEVDPNRNLGSFQSDQIQTHGHSTREHNHVGQPHTHSFQTNETGNHTHIARTTSYHGFNSEWESQGFPRNEKHVSFKTTDRQPERDISSDAVRHAGNHVHAGNTDPSAVNTNPAQVEITELLGTAHGSETRPKNIALLYCIKF